MPDGTPEPPYTRGRELYYHPATWPGMRLPFCWLGARGRNVSTHDVTGKGRFSPLTGISGRRWADAAAAVGARLGIEITAHVIGPGRDLTDLYDDWARLREVAEDGCVLVRPDAHVACAVERWPMTRRGRSRSALRAVLSRAQGSANAAGSSESPAATAAS